MNAMQSMRNAIFLALRENDFQVRDARIDRQHIFYSILQSLKERANKGCRLPLIHEFSMIEKLVSAARRQNDYETVIWQKELKWHRDVTKRFSGDLDVLYLPAAALINFNAGEAADAVSKLRVTIDLLEVHFAQGVASAGIAAIEQRLNILRTLCSYPLNSIVGAAADTLTAAIDGSVSGKDGRIYRLRGELSDSLEILAYYVDEVVKKLLFQDRPLAFHHIVRDIWPKDFASEDMGPIRYVLDLIDKAYSGQITPLDIDEVDGILITKVPISLILILDGVTSAARPEKEVDDDLALMLNAHRSRARFLLQVEKSMGYRCPELISSH